MVLFINHNFEQPQMLKIDLAWYIKSKLLTAKNIAPINIHQSLQAAYVMFMRVLQGNIWMNWRLQ